MGVTSTKGVTDVRGNGDIPQYDCFHFGFRVSLNRYPLNTSTAITILLTWEQRRQQKERFSFRPTFQNPVCASHHTPHLDFFSQRSHYWQHSPFSLTSPWMFLNLQFFHLQPKIDLKSKQWFHLNVTILIPLDVYFNLDCFKASLSNWIWIKRK